APEEPGGGVGVGVGVGVGLGFGLGLVPPAAIAISYAAFGTNWPAPAMQPSASPGSLIHRKASIIGSPVLVVLGVRLGRPRGSPPPSPAGALPLRLVSMAARREGWPRAESTASALATSSAVDR